MDKPWKVIAAFVGVFVFGGVFGGLLSLRFADQQSPRRGGGPPPRAQAGAPGILNHLVERLELTAEQRETFRPMVERAEEDLRRIRTTGFRETGIVFRRLHEDLAKDLTPEQRKRLERMQERQNEVLRDDRGGFGRGDRSGGGGGRRAGRPDVAPAEIESAPAGK